MAKRFTDTDKFKKRFIRGLEPAYKLFWMYLMDDCNHAGIWEVDFEIASIYCGTKIDPKLAESRLKSKIVVFDGGNKWFIPGFIEFQYGQLNTSNRAHNSVVILLNKYKLVKGAYKGLITPLQGRKDMDMDMDKDKDKEKSKNLNFPFESKRFLSAWELWKKYKKDEFGFKYASESSEQGALTHLNNLSQNNENTAIKTIEHAIANGWKGFYEIEESVQEKEEKRINNLKKKLDEKYA